MTNPVYTSKSNPICLTKYLHLGPLGYTLKQTEKSVREEHSFENLILISYLLSWLGNDRIIVLQLLQLMTGHLVQ